METGLLGPIIGAIGLLVTIMGGVGGYFTLRADVKAESREAARRFAEGEADRKDMRARLEQVDRETVKRDDFNRFDDKIAARFKDMEHIVNNSAMKAEAAVKNVLRDFLKPARGSE